MAGLGTQSQPLSLPPVLLESEEPPPMPEAPPLLGVSPASPRSQALLPTEVRWPPRRAPG